MEYRVGMPLELQKSQRKLAELLLQRAAPERPGISRAEMASLLDISPDTLNILLVSLQSKNAIRIERHRLFLHKQILARIATEPVSVRAYGLLKTREGTSEQALSIMRCQPGVIITDWVEGSADVVFAIEADDRESLAARMVQAIAALEWVTEDVQLLPVR